MTWSQIKKTIESRFADSVRGRVEIWYTRYRKAHDQQGEFWITIDKKRICSISDFTFQAAIYNAEVQLGLDPSKPVWSQYDDNRRHRAEEIVRRQGVLSELGDDIYPYPHMKIEDILSSDNPTIQALGMLDKRLGKRRLTKLGMENRHPLVKTLYEFRCSVEKVHNTLS